MILGVKSTRNWKISRNLITNNPLNSSIIEIYEPLTKWDEFLWWIKQLYNNENKDISIISLILVFGFNCIMVGLVYLSKNFSDWGYWEFVGFNISFFIFHFSFGQIWWKKVKNDRECYLFLFKSTYFINLEI